MATPAPMQPGRKIKREWAGNYKMVNPTAPTPQASDIAAASAYPTDTAGPVAQERDVTAPSILRHAFPGPSGTQG